MKPGISLKCEKKSLQAQVADMAGAIAADYFDKHPLSELWQSLGLKS